MNMADGVQEWRRLLHLPGTPHDDRPGQGVLSVHTIRDVRYHLNQMTTSEVTRMAVAWGAFLAIMSTEIHREMADTTSASDSTSLMQEGLEHRRGGRGGDGNDGNDKIPGRPTKKYRRDSRRRSLSQRRRNIEQEVAELSTNLRNSYGSVWGDSDQAPACFGAKER